VGTRSQPPARGAGATHETLQVIERLVVERPVLARKRLSATYRVTSGGRTDALELLYRYEEPVFRPDEEASLNLASLIAAQVALNYGLFCREIRFNGLYDATDRAFLEEMARNTAREIYVKKFLQPNPFLRGPAASLAAEKRDDYLLARLNFPSEPASGSEPGEWSVERSRHAVLSSGGKDSLLSFGLLQELGGEPQAIYVNESGRHWFTALNAYRHFRDAFRGTARVWTNSDRLFSWMLRRLPFIRPDFADVRSDEYPVRLWTVAVFLFGALPLLRKRGIGRLVIGDEYDTTVRARHAGIPHYDGLYDQSLFFDVALTRYFARKGWRVSQFSLLRPLSELLIEKVLVERYPDLQRHQTSCHATHLDGERVYPCGRCEKCRRIVGMLVALGADPRRCGYGAEQIARCLEELASRRVHQERAGEEQLRFLLTRAGKLPEPGPERKAPVERPEILGLRFDAERSPLDAVPTNLRRPLYRILLEHAAGAFRREGRAWVGFDALADPALDLPYAGEQAPAPARTVRRAAAREAATDYLLGELTWPEAKQRLQQTDLALLPVGAVEQHGPHLPLDVDAWDADYLARRVAEGCSKPRPLVLPLVPYGVSYHHEDFSGTLSISPETLASVVYEIGLDVARQGITKLVIINGHGGNVPTLQFAAQKINRDAHIFTCVDTGDTSDADVARLTETPNDVHAGEIETSTALATRPELVQMERARKLVPRFSSQYLEFSSARGVQWYARTARISASGVLGDPTKASREKGERIWEIQIRNLVEFIETLKGMSLDEIYERRD
jgi:creatinine amidohydrolase/Fe(II)-dependent formamide hydrolase-like protein